MPQHETPDADAFDVEIDGGYPFAMVPKWVTALIADGLISHGALAAFVVLLGYADNHTGRAFPSLATLAADLNRSAKQARRLVAELESVGAVHVQTRRREAARNLPNLYRLAVRGAFPEDRRSRPPRPVDNPPGGVGDTSVPHPEPADSGGVGDTSVREVGVMDVPRTRFTKELDSPEKEMPIRSADRPRAEADPVENPAKAAPTARAARLAQDADFQDFWTAYRAASDRPAGSKRRAAISYAVARKSATAAELLDRLAEYTAGRSRQRSAAGFVAAFPDAERWLRDERWQDYAPAAADGASGAPGGSGTSPAHLAAVEALRGPYSPPDLPADLSPDDYRAARAADRSDWLAGTGRWAAAD